MAECLESYFRAIISELFFLMIQAKKCEEEYDRV
jgi:hypothetical protein